jgi:hypothetical protein
MRVQPVAVAIVFALIGCRSAGNSEGAANRPDSAPPPSQQPMTDSTTIRTSGTVHAVNLEGGCWRFDAQDGRQYEIEKGSAPKPRPDLMSTCMIGPIAQVVRVEP